MTLQSILPFSVFKTILDYELNDTITQQLHEVGIVDGGGRILQGFSAFTKLGPRVMGITIARFFENKKTNNSTDEDRLRVANTIRNWNIEFRERFLLGMHDTNADEAQKLSKLLARKQ